MSFVHGTEGRGKIKSSWTRSIICYLLFAKKKKRKKFNDKIPIYFWFWFVGGKTLLFYSQYETSIHRKEFVCRARGTHQSSRLLPRWVWTTFRRRSQASHRKFFSTQWYFSTKSVIELYARVGLGRKSFNFFFPIHWIEF